MLPRPYNFPSSFFFSRPCFNRAASFLMNKIVTQVLDACKQYQNGRVTVEVTPVTFDFTEGWFRTSGLYDLTAMYVRLVLKVVASFVAAALVFGSIGCNNKLLDLVKVPDSLLSLISAASLIFSLLCRSVSAFIASTISSASTAACDP